MALHVAVCLLAALAAASEDASHGHVRAVGLIWGVTMGLALAHVFALPRDGFSPSGSGSSANHVAQQSGASRVRSTLYGVSTLVLAIAIAVVKNTLSGH